MAISVPELRASDRGDLERRGQGQGLVVITRALTRPLTEEQRARWVQLIGLAADDAGLPADPEFRSAFMAYIEWGTRVALHNSQPDADRHERRRCRTGAGAKRRRTTSRGLATNEWGLPASRGEGAEAKTQTPAERRGSLSAPRIEVCAAERTAGRKGAHPLTATGTDMRSDRFHAISKEDGHFQGVRGL
jgi:hypothetical protein